jgi:hypothetical protein
MLFGTNPAKADFTFGTPTKLESNNRDSASLTADGLEAYFTASGPNSYGRWDIYVSTRQAEGDPWGPAVNLGPEVNGSGLDGQVSISADGLELIFMSSRPGGLGRDDLWVTARTHRDGDWSTPVNLGSTVNSPSADFGPCLTHDGLSLYFTSQRSDGFGESDLWVTTRATTDDPWRTPVNLGPNINTSHHEALPSISADGRVLFFSDFAVGPYRPGGQGGQDIWYATRPTIDDPWGEAVNLGPTVNSPAWDFEPSISADGSTLYFASDRDGPGFLNGGAVDNYHAPILPVIDLNGDGRVDGTEILIMASRWDQADPSSDIGPMPWGDGVVDVEDLKVLARYIGEELDDPTLLAHWAMDETGGFTVHDSAGGHDGRVMGFPAWRPGAGRIGGALQLDGTGFVTADHVLDPSDGPLSVLAWVKGGLPGQVIVSQEGGANWLMIDPLDATLMTELRAGGRSPENLGSEAAIADDNWHLVALTWDGAYRRLYVDDVLVAEDAQDAIEGAVGRQLIGCGKSMTPVSYFTGLIDDVRAYNRAVRP